jgi:hypothetical protein
MLLLGVVADWFGRFRRPVIGDVPVELLGYALLRHRRSPKIQSDGTIVELGDPHASCFPDPHRKDALVVHGLAQLADGPPHFGS